VFRPSNDGSWPVSDRQLKLTADGRLMTLQRRCGRSKADVQDWKSRPWIRHMLSGSRCAAARRADSTCRT